MRVNVYGSAKKKNPGFDASMYNPIATLDTRMHQRATFEAVSLRAKERSVLGKYRWILIESSPVTDQGEHTAFQEIRIEP